MRISDWSSDVCSSDLLAQLVAGVGGNMVELVHRDQPIIEGGDAEFLHREAEGGMGADQHLVVAFQKRADARSEEHTSELQSLMRISYAVFCLQKKKNTKQTRRHYTLQVNKEDHYSQTFTNIQRMT